MDDENDTQEKHTIVDDSRIEQSPEVQQAETPAVNLGSAEKTSADDLIADDTDSPKADNRVPPPAAPESALEAELAGNVAPPDGAKKRGRRKMTDEEKARAKEIRDAIKSNRAPDFSKLPAGGSAGVSGRATPPRDYYLEACNLFFPCSFVAEKWLGQHWGVPIIEKSINGIPQKVLEPTDEQKQYLANMARWLEYEQFPELSPRWAFLIATAAYTAPKLKTEPTPARLRSAWEWVRVKILRKEPRKLEAVK